LYNCFRLDFFGEEGNTVMCPQKGLFFANLYTWFIC
jgi:hypothetical protein